MRARLALHYSSCKVELREVVLRDMPAAMLQASPKATVPVFVLANGTVIDESLDIMHWALAQSDPEGWLSQLESSQQQLADELIHQNDNDFKSHLDHYKYAVRFPERSMQDYRAEGEVFLARLEQLLEKNVFLLSGAMSIADAAIFPFVRQFAHVDKTWFDQAPYSKLQAWLAAQMDAARFAAVMQKYTQWHEGDEVVVFP